MIFSVLPFVSSKKWVRVPTFLGALWNKKWWGVTEIQALGCSANLFVYFGLKVPVLAPDLRL